ncbi:flagellin [Janthinobacterium sp. LB2P10]|nr:hypothetical protein [Janthinobacterium lividum]
MHTDTKAAVGRIMELDCTAEGSNMRSVHMLLQASTAMLQQSKSKLIISLMQYLLAGRDGGSD